MAKEKDILKARANTPEEYDEYFQIVKDIGLHRAKYRARKSVELIDGRFGKVLSVGIGGLCEAIELKKIGFDLTLCDISPKAVRYAVKSGYNAFVCDISKDQQIEEKYDYIFVLEVLEHLVNPIGAIENLKTILNENGKLIISLPNEFNLRARLCILFGKPIFGGYDWHHLRFFNRKLAEKLFTDAKLNIIKRTYCPLIPLWNQLSIIIGEFLMIISPNLFSLSTIWVLKNEFKHIPQKNI